MCNSGVTLRIIFIFWFKCVLKGFWTCVERLRKICSPVSFCELCVKLTRSGAKYGKTTLTLTLTLASRVHQNDKRFMCAPRFMSNSGSSLRIITFLTHMGTKRLVNTCAKFWENILNGFWFMDFTSNWHEPGQSKHKRSGSK